MLAVGDPARAPAAGGRWSERVGVNRERLSTHEALAIRARSLTPPRAPRGASSGTWVQPSAYLLPRPPLLLSSCDAFAVEAARRCSIGIRHELP